MAKLVHQDFSKAPRILSASNVRPVGDQTLVRVCEEDQVPQVIAMADGARGVETVVGRVVAVGPKVTEFATGDLVFVNPSCFLSGIVHRKDAVLLVKESEVGAVLGADLVEWLHRENARIVKDRAALDSNRQ